MRVVAHCVSCAIFFRLARCACSLDSFRWFCFFSCFRLRLCYFVCERFASSNAYITPMHVLSESFREKCSVNTERYLLQEHQLSYSSLPLCVAHFLTRTQALIACDVMRLFVSCTAAKIIGPVIVINLFLSL